MDPLFANQERAFNQCRVGQQEHHRPGLIKVSAILIGELLPCGGALIQQHLPPKLPDPGLKDGLVQTVLSQVVIVIRYAILVQPLPGLADRIAIFYADKSIHQLTASINQ